MKFSIRYYVLLLSFCFFSSVVTAQTSDPLSDLFADEPEFLQVDEAFQFDFAQQGDQLTLSWKIADGYYLYKKQFKTVVKQAELGMPVFPVAEQIEDEFYGLSDVFRNQLDITYPIVSSVQDGIVKIRYQGCADAGLCYPPTTREVYLNQVGNVSEAESNQLSKDSAIESNTQAPISEQFELASLLSSEQSLFITLLLFLGLGIGLAFTPCVFPMYPILSGIVIGQGKTISTSRAFTLSFVYVQGMAITYSLLGLIVASAGVQFQAGLQHPAILIALIVIFVLLAVVMFGAYELQLPSSWQEKLNAMSNKQTSGSYFGVLAMGAISGLVASPCTTAPLTGILLFIAQSGDLVLGFSALYVLSLGMGIPLILFGITGGKLLPKAGNWMNVVKVTFGFMMLAVAIMFVERLVSHVATDIAWTLLGLTTFTYFFVMNQNSPTNFYKGLRAFLIFIGLFFSAGYGYQTFNGFGHSDTQAQSNNTPVAHQEFLSVSSIESFNLALAEANANGQTVMLDLYADWCVACKEFEKYTFPDSQVVAALSDSVLMQIDLTDNTDNNIAFQEKFSVLGLPTILFFDTQGQEISTARVTGFMRAAPFAEHVNNLFAK
ncbi:thiol:disulfide interchange protein [Paraglaciecola psychrophila 170]|uniref:Thiol:disulfide interchange protein DsbD n=1 Tax=Paraglaciecola psychrophila 170 TaxID=1129794 RepID=K6ZQM3_9ALTE|nr:protein-disulfide reductase DsbD [Paraglaciecola psychrophila]AGH42251.1 thiol:disulfide interchange protein [Paraglaciecola psychrophila 170]GAC38241.1 thiol:disulfide interchange protein DsbD [Paraglaciecola psychrophila 170]